MSTAASTTNVYTAITTNPATSKFLVNKLLTNIIP